MVNLNTDEEYHALSSREKSLDWDVIEMSTYITSTMRGKTKFRSENSEDT